MTKQQAIALFGRRPGDLAAALGITRSAVAQWPDVLPLDRADRVRGAAVRLNVPLPAELLGRESEAARAA